MLGFVDAIDAHNNGNSSDLEKPSSSERVYRDFLLYTNFYAAKTPVVLSEGETDNIYLTHAIRSLAAEFPDLAEVVNGKIRLKIRLFKYPHSSTARILQLKGGGSGVLGNFIGKYNRETRHFTAPGLTHPVVILYDNDAGAKSVRSAIKQVAKLTVTGDEPFVRVVKNIYALPVPHVAGATESKIEDCFDAQTKAVMVDGKTFNDSNVIDPAVHFGKNVFAHRVVRPKAEAIDFSGFRPLLANLVTIISTHKAEYTAANTGA